MSVPISHDFVIEVEFGSRCADAQDMQQYIAVNRKVTREKMRKYQFFVEEPETRESE